MCTTPYAAVPGERPKACATAALNAPTSGEGDGTLAQAAAYSGVVASPSPPRVTLIAKPGCHLCDEARAVIERVTADLGVGWDELSIEDDRALAEQYWEQVPVTLVDGRQHDYWRVSEARLREALGA